MSDKPHVIYGERPKETMWPDKVVDEASERKREAENRAYLKQYLSCRYPYMEITDEFVDEIILHETGPV